VEERYVCLETDRRGWSQGRPGSSPLDHRRRRTCRGVRRGRMRARRRTRKATASSRPVTGCTVAPPRPAAAERGTRLPSAGTRAPTPSQLAGTSGETSAEWGTAFRRCTSPVGTPQHPPAADQLATIEIHVQVAAVTGLARRRVEHQLEVFLSSRLQSNTSSRPSRAGGLSLFSATVLGLRTAARAQRRRPGVRRGSGLSVLSSSCTGDSGTRSLPEHTQHAILH